MHALYETLDEARRRLCETIVMYDGEPHMVRDVSGNNARIKLYLRRTWDSHDLDPVYLDDPKLNYRDYRIGYINLDTEATFAARIPTRGHYKQGLYSGNMSFTKVRAPGGGTYCPEYNSIYMSLGFRSMLKGEYPSVRTAIERLTAINGPTTVAIHPWFAVRYNSFRKDYELDYKGERVGYGKGTNFELPEEYHYLKELTSKCGIALG